MSDLASTYLAQAREHLVAGNAEKAIDLLEHAIVVGPSSDEVAGRVFSTLADAYQRAGQLRKASECRKRAEALRPEPVRRVIVPSPTAGVEPSVHRVPSAKGKWYILGAATVTAVLIAFLWLAREGSRDSRPTSEPDQPPPTSQETPVYSATDSGRSSSPTAQGDLPSLFRQVSPSTVAVFTYDKTGKLYGQASGFFVSDDGDVITNWHVLAEAWRAQIKTSKDGVFPVRHIVAEDEEADLVRISVDVGSKSVVPLSMSNSTLQTGERVMVISDPLGLERTVTEGIVSAAVREFPPFGKVVQVTAAISPGSSGGPVVNMKGEVIGVAKGGISAVAGQGLNFAIPAERVSRLRLRTGKTIAEWQSGRAGVGLASADALFRKGIVFMLANDYDQALPCFEKATQKNSQLEDAWFCLGYCQVQLQRWSEAAGSFKQAIRVKPYFAEAHWLLGITYTSAGRHSEAITAHKTAIRIKPDDAWMYYGLGISYLMAEDRKSALEQYKILKDLDESLADELFNEIYR